MKKIISLFVFLFSNMALAMVTLSVKDKSVLLSLDAKEIGQVSVGSLATSADKSTEIKILQVRRARAIGKIIKGSAKSEMSFYVRNSVKNSSDHSAIKFGMLGGISSNTLNIATATTKEQLKGIGFNLLGFIDYQIGLDFTVRGNIGFENYKVSSPSSFCESGTCSVNINYFNVSGLLQYDFIKFAGDSRAWVGAGAGNLILSSAKSEIINVNTIQSTQIALLAMGVDYQLSANRYLPLQVDYFIYPNGEVSRQQINFRIGYKF